MLVQCSLFGEDPYWGRIVCELGSAGIAFDIDRVPVAYGGTVVCAAGVARGRTTTAAVAAHMAGPPHRARLRPRARRRARRWCSGTDLSYGYIDENRTTS